MMGLFHINVTYENLNNIIVFSVTAFTLIASNKMKIEIFLIQSNIDKAGALLVYNPAGNYMFRVNNRNTRATCEICSKLTIKIPERCLYC